MLSFPHGQFQPRILKIPADASFLDVVIGASGAGICTGIEMINDFMCQQ
jgi:ABC-type proline/glycine betaine transport system ATPase subunit